MRDSSSPGETWMVVTWHEDGQLHESVLHEDMARVIAEVVGGSLRPLPPPVDSRSPLHFDRHLPGQHDQHKHGVGGGTYYPQAEIERVRALAVEKYRKAHKPTAAETKKQRKLYEEFGADRVESNQRGSSTQRRRSRKSLLTEFGDGTNACCAYCGVKMDDTTVTRERMYPGAIGGRYRRDNLIPADIACNKSRSDKPFDEVIAEWGMSESMPTAAMFEAAARQIALQGKRVRAVEWCEPGEQDHLPRRLEGVLHVRKVPVLNYTQYTIDAIPVDPSTIEEV